MAGAYISYVAAYVDVPVVAGKFLTRWSNAGVSVALLLTNRQRERERERENRRVILDDVVSC